MMVGAGVVAAALLLAGLPVAAGFWVFGLGVGYLVQRSRLCFVGAVRDLLLWRIPSLARAVALLLAVSLVGVAAVQRFTGAPGNVFPVGWHTVVGGLLFGLGMGLAGSCALTTLVRLGEGTAVYALALAGLVGGGLIGLVLRAWWTARLGAGTVVFLPDVLGWPLSLLAGLAALGGIALAAGLAGSRARGRSPAGASASRAGREFHAGGAG